MDSFRSVKPSFRESRPFLTATIVILFSGFALGQTLGAYPSASGAPSGVAIPSAQGPFGGSVAPGKATGTVLPISFAEAIDRGLQNNLGVLLQADNTVAARGQK